MRLPAMLSATHGVAPRSSLAMMTGGLESSTMTLSASALDVLTSPLADPIATAFEVVTLLPQPFWLLMILLPNTGITRSVFGPIGPLAFLALAHLASNGPTIEFGTFPCPLACSERPRRRVSYVVQSWC